MSTKATWDDLVQVVRGLSNRKNGPPVQGGFTITDAEALRVLKACIESEPETHARLQNGEDAASLNIGQTIEVEISPRLGFGLLTANIGALLHAQYARIKEPSNFLLLDELINKTDLVSDNHLLTKYRATLSLIQTLKRSAAFLDQEEPSLVFIKDGKFEVPIEYDDDTLSKLDVAVILEITSILPEETHEKQCCSILADAIITLTGHLSSGDRFKHLLIHAAELKKLYDQGHQLYAAGFSYEKIRDEIEGARIEYSGKIHKVFSDIQNQLLSIPVATIIVATQMKEHAQIDGNFWISIAVLIGSFIFMLLMHFLLRNQKQTLEVIGIEIKRQKGKLKKEHAAIAQNFVDTFTSLDNRYDTQLTILKAVDFVVFFGFLLSVFFFYKLSTPTQVWLQSLW